MHTVEAYSSRLQHRWIVFTILNIVVVPTLVSSELVVDTQNSGKHTFVLKSIPSKRFV